MYIRCCAAHIGIAGEDVIREFDYSEFMHLKS